MKRFISLLLFLGAASLAPAQLLFSVSGTANATGSGYTSGQAVTFNFAVTGANLSGYSWNSFTSGNNLWQQEFTSETALFTSITGTGLSGTFTVPNATTGDPLLYLQAMAPTGTQLTLQAGAERVDLGSNIGLIAGSTTVTGIIAGSLNWGQSFPAPQTYTAPESFFNSYLGTHPLSGGYMTLYLSGGSTVAFTASSLTISTVPEPATYAALGLGLIALSVAGFIRRHRSAA